MSLNDRVARLEAVAAPQTDEMQWPYVPPPQEFTQEEQLVISQFFAIDEMRIPSKAEFITGFHPFAFHREQFRYKRSSLEIAIERNRLVDPEIDEMREWLALVETYGNLEGA